MKALLDEVIRQRKAGLPINVPAPPVVTAGNGGKGRENEKNLDRLKRDLSQLPLVGGAVPNKRPRLEPAPESKLSTPSPTAPITVEDHEEMDLDL